jgi:transcription elongation factor GreA
MAAEQVPMTQEGFSRLQKELDNLRSVERPSVIEAIAEARSHGDLKENAEYHAAREKQGIVEARIKDLEDKLTRASVVDLTKVKTDQVRFGANVTIVDEESGDEKTYQIVGDIEADLSNGKISMSSPIAKALLGKKLDDVVSVRVPAGVRECVITEVEYG